MPATIHDCETRTAKRHADSPKISINPSRRNSRRVYGTDKLTRGTTRVRFDRSIHVPDDEICFFVFDAPSGGDAALAAQRAELDPIRVVEAVSSGKEEE